MGWFELELGGGGPAATGAGASVPARAELPPPQSKGVRVAAVRDTAGRGTWLWHAGRTFFLADGPSGRRRSQESADSTIHAPLTGRVVQVLVVPGAEVGTDDVLVVLEAMKMEYRLRPPREGTVDRVAAEVGALVDKGSVLVALQPLRGGGASGGASDHGPRPRDEASAESPSAATPGDSTRPAPEST